MRWIKPLTFAVLTPMLLAGCGGDREDLEQWIAEVRSRPPAQVDPIPRIVTPQPVVYAADDLRDPFQRQQTESEEVAESVGSTGPQPDPDRRREYLERFPLDTLAMVGTITLEDQTFGLISDAEDTIHRVREGNYMGQNHGRILRITPVAIELMELVPDGAGGWMEREARIALPEQNQQG